LGSPAPVRKAWIERRVAAGQTLFHQDERVIGLYEFIEGRFRLARPNLDGSEIVLYVAAAEETIAEASLFSPKYHCDAIAVTDAVVRLYPKAAMFAEFERCPEVAKKYMATLAGEVMNLRSRLEQRNIRSARDRVRHYLAVNVGADGRTVQLRGTVKELAGCYPSLRRMVRLSDWKARFASQKKRSHDPDHMRSLQSAVKGF
jgi:CRP-like cAMP-binding protein